MNHDWNPPTATWTPPERNFRRVQRVYLRADKPNCIAIISITMKKLLVTLLGFACALTLTVNAAEGKKEHKKLTADEKKELKELKDKYDTNKDGKLDKDEKAKMSKEDKEKYAKLTGSSKESKDE